MKCLTIMAFAAFAAFVAAKPVPEAEPVPDAVAEPAPDAVAEPWKFYGSSGTAVVKRNAEAEDLQDNGKRTLIVKRDDIIPEALLEKRSDLTKRTQSPTTGPDANRCGPFYSDYICDVGNAGLCCSQHSYCGSTSYHCGGACRVGYGTCVYPYLQLQYDADDGDAIWDVVTDNVFDADVGDGIAYYGSTPTVGWPA